MVEVMKREPALIWQPLATLLDRLIDDRPASVEALVDCLNGIRVLAHEGQCQLRGLPEVPACLAKIGLGTNLLDIDPHSLMPLSSDDPSHREIAGKRGFLNRGGFSYRDVEFGAPRMPEPPGEADLSELERDKLAELREHGVGRPSCIADVFLENRLRSKSGRLARTIAGEARGIQHAFAQFEGKTPHQRVIERHLRTIRDNLGFDVILKD